MTDSQESILAKIGFSILAFLAWPIDLIWHVIMFATFPFMAVYIIFKE